MADGTREQFGGGIEHPDMRLIDYILCYRSPAGTGRAMAFAQWQ